jgi:hypothetical protein
MPARLLVSQFPTLDKSKLLHTLKKNLVGYHDGDHALLKLLAAAKTKIDGPTLL